MQPLLANRSTRVEIAIFAIFVGIGLPIILLHAYLFPEIRLGEAPHGPLVTSTWLAFVGLFMLGVALFIPDRAFAVPVSRLVLVFIVATLCAGTYYLSALEPIGKQQCRATCQTLGKSAAWVPKPMSGHRTRMGWELDYYCRCD